jgi:dGTPase
MWNKAGRIINDLFDVYKKDPNQLPPEIYPRGSCPDEEKYRIICNHIASMTDRAALDEHKRLFNAYTKV